MKIVIVAGARPNFMKVAPLLKALRKVPRFQTALVHTGQHYDFRMSEVFFKDLLIPKPGVHLECGSGTHAGQTGKVLAAMERTLLKLRPDLVMVVGDVNSALASSLAAAKLGIRVAHVEAGLRSFDRSMPEEINRRVTDRLSDFLFVSEESGLVNLKREGIPPQKVFHTGNVMIDSLVASLGAIRRSDVRRRLGLADAAYGVMTLHRPSNVDDAKALKKIWHTVAKVSSLVTLIFPIHPRTAKRMDALGLRRAFQGLKNLRMIKPLGYTDFLGLVYGARFVLTDSGGLQEESTYLKIPCMTLRENTERPATLKPGSNRLVGTDEKKILEGVRSALSGRWKTSKVPKYWDGKAAKRIVQALIRQVKN